VERWLYPGARIKVSERGFWGVTLSGEAEREAPAQTELRPTRSFALPGASPYLRQSRMESSLFVSFRSRLSSALRFFLRFSRRNAVSLFRKRWVLSRDSVGWPEGNEIRD
jgi:hypothetical protein